MLHDIFGLISPTEAAESRAAAAEQELSLLRQVRLVPHGEILWKMMGMMGWYGFRMSNDFPDFHGWWKWVLEMWLVMFGSGGNVAVAASASVCVLLLQCSWFTVTTVYWQCSISCLVQTSLDHLETWIRMQNICWFYQEFDTCVS